MSLSTNNQTEPIDFRSLSIEDSLTKLSASPTGLSVEDASNRLETYGYNEITEKKDNPLVKFLTYFWGPIPWMIEAAAILLAVIGHWEDFGTRRSLK